MKEEKLTCRVCSATQEPFKQGESIVMQIKIQDENGKPLRNLKEYYIRILLMSSRAVVGAYSNGPKWGDEPIEVDDDGYIAFEVGTKQTAEMSGEYYLELALAHEGSQIITATLFAFEVHPSLIEQIGII